MSCPSWVSLHGIAHSFSELLKPLRHDKAAIHEGEATPVDAIKTGGDAQGDPPWRASAQQRVTRERSDLSLGLRCSSLGGARGGGGGLWPGRSLRKGREEEERPPPSLKGAKGWMKRGVCVVVGEMASRASLHALRGLQGRKGGLPQEKKRG